jgi:DNA-binding MarR family transcriptional regulator
MKDQGTDDAVPSTGLRQPLRPMELYQLRAFATVMRLGHLTRAAEQLHLSQPAVSHQIEALEELGVA